MAHQLKITNILILCVTFLTVQCTTSERPTQENLERSVNYTDDMGSHVEVPVAPEKVIGLAPSITEMLFKVCPDSMIVGRTQNCNYPEEAISKREVNTYPLDQEALLLIRPDVVFALENINSPQDIIRMRELGLNVFVLKTDCLDSVFRAIQKIENIVNVQNPPSKRYSEQFYEDLNKFKIKKENTRGNAPAESLTFLALAAQTPIYVYGINTVFTEKLNILGFQNAIRDTFPSNYPEVNTEYILKCNPDVILGGTFESMDSSFFRLYPELKKINAYKNHCVYSVSDDLMSRPGPRIIESMKELKQIGDDAMQRIKAQANQDTNL